MPHTYLKLKCECPSCTARIYSTFCAIINHNYDRHELDRISHDAYQGMTVEEWQKSRV